MLKRILENMKKRLFLVILSGSSSVKIRYCVRVVVCNHWTEEEMYNSFLYQTTDNRE